jgi:hypothetical protein
VSPSDIGRKKQNEFTRQVVKACSELSRLDVAAEDIEETLNLALDLLPNCGGAYVLGGPVLRRQWNQVFFERMNVDVDKVTDSTLRSPFDAMLDPAAITTGKAQAPPAGALDDERLLAMGADTPPVSNPFLSGPV